MGTGTCGSLEREVSVVSPEARMEEGIGDGSGSPLCVWFLRVCSAAPNYLPFQHRKVGDGYPLCGSNPALAVLSTY